MRYLVKGYARHIVRTALFSAREYTYAYINSGLYNQEVPHSIVKVGPHWFVHPVSGALPGIREPTSNVPLSKCKTIPFWHHVKGQPVRFFGQGTWAAEEPRRLTSPGVQKQQTVIRCIFSVSRALGSDRKSLATKQVHFAALKIERFVVSQKSENPPPLDQ